MQEMVAEFHRACGGDIGETPGLRKRALRKNLIEEEAGEVLSAIESGRLDRAIHELCDLLYVAFGAAVTWGIDIEEPFRLVHEANMTKVKSGKRADGKVTKGADYVPPDIEGWLKKAKAPLKQSEPVKAKSTGPKMTVE
jgi:predicted HAD superfamily Cof-like phosphohydrolase